MRKIIKSNKRNLKKGRKLEPCKSLNRGDENDRYDRFYFLAENNDDFGVSSAVYMYWNF